MAFLFKISTKKFNGNPVFVISSAQRIYLWQGWQATVRGKMRGKNIGEVILRSPTKKFIERGAWGSRVKKTYLYYLAVFLVNS